MDPVFDPEQATVLVQMGQPISGNPTAAEATLEGTDVPLEFMLYSCNVETCVYGLNMFGLVQGWGRSRLKV